MRRWYNGFQKDCPTGKLAKSEFTRIFIKLFPHGDARNFAHHVFTTFDENGDGALEFNEFLQALSICSRLIV